MVTQALMALPALALFALTVAGSVTPLIVWALVFVRGTVNAVDNPTRQSFVIELVGAERVVNAVSLNSVIVQSARIIGPATAGAVIAFAGVERVLRPQRAVLRRHARRPRRDGPGGAARRRRRCSAPAASCAPRLRYVQRQPGAVDPAGA